MRRLLFLIFFTVPFGSAIASKSPTANNQLPTANYQLPTANYQLPTANYQLPTANYLLPTANYLLPTANYQLPTANCQLPPTLNKQAFYKAMAENNKALVDSQLSILHSAYYKNKEAFEGALLMKKAGLGGSALSKLHLFKEGRKKLEATISQDPDNAEYRFLRLMIQENAPGFLGYQNDLNKDSEFIRKSYKSLPEAVQHAIAEYNKKSKILKLDLS